jgi:prepilin-type N-terminal cleavage/methylation domain-containing protein
VKRTNRRGFTLVELMIAVVIAAFTVLVAANVATVVVRQAAKGRQATDFNSRARVIGKQLRHDIRLAGIGSTGLITASGTFAAFTSATTFGGYQAMPVIRGCNNVAGPAPILAGSDVVQMVVANPSIHATTDQISAAAATTLTMDPLAALGGFAPGSCPLVYIVDHSTPGGNGRTQIAVNLGPAGNVIQVGDPLNFAVAQGSDVMCARISTYWVDDTDGDGFGNFLARSDITGAPGPNVCAGVFLPAGFGPADMIAPGVVDMQIAYNFSAEVFRNAGVGLAASEDARWAYNGVGNVDPLIAAAPLDWSEVRMVRFNILTKRMRAIDNFATTVLVPVAPTEDRAGMGPLPAAVTPEWLTATEVLTNLRYFDAGMPANVLAEPY